MLEGNVKLPVDWQAVVRAILASGLTINQLSKVSGVHDKTLTRLRDGLQNDIHFAKGCVLLNAYRSVSKGDIPCRT